MGFDFDWQAEVTTSRPDYYQHTQKIFQQMLEKKLAYKAAGWVNWDPVD